MKIFYIAEFDCSDHIGNAAHVRGVVNSLSWQGHQIYLFVAGWRPETGSNVRFIRIPQWRRRSLYSISFTVACIPLLLWWLVRARPDIGYARFFNTLPFLAFLFRLFRIPLVVEFNADQATEHVAYGRNRLRRAFWRWAERTVYRNASGIVAVAPSIVDSLRRRFPRIDTPAVVIENGVNIDEYRPLDRTDCKSSLGLTPTARYVVFVGAFQPWQGLETLVCAAPGIVAQVPEVVIILVGGTEAANRSMNERLSALGIASHFLLPGAVAPDVAACYIGAGEVCVAPYNELAADRISTGQAPPLRMKGSPLKVFSYLACGRPVVASDYQEAGRFVREIGAGLEFPRGDSDALQQAVVFLLQQPTLAARMGRDGAEYIRLHCTWQAVSARVTEFLDKIHSNYQLAAAETKAV